MSTPVKRSFLLFEKYKHIAEKVFLHPFLQGILDGTLNKQKFVTYLEQDALFLVEYSTALLSALEKRPADDPARPTLIQVLNAVEGEVNLHHLMADSLGITLHPVGQLNSVAKAYADFVAKAASDEAVAQLAAALTPCSRLYTWIGAKMAKSASTNTGPYAVWIKAYCDPKLEEITGDLEDLLDGPSAQHERQEELYCRALDLEYQFFNSVW